MKPALQLAAPRVDEKRLRAAVQSHFTSVWRVLRRNGVSDADSDDAAQKVFMIFSQRMDDVALANERGFLLSTAVFVANDVRRSQRRREAATAQSDTPNETLQPDDAFARTQALEQLDAALFAMDESTRAIFVLFELEEMTTAAIAEALQIPLGTVASRLRRARAQFEMFCARQREEDLI